MALTVEVTKAYVNKQGEQVWYIVLNLRCLDGATEVINKNFSTRYEAGDDVQEVVKEILVRMQNEIDDCKTERQLFNKAQLDTAVTWLQNNLEG
jgi:hypothetical protein